jgi:tRNA modification GTPase
VGVVRVSGAGALGVVAGFLRLRRPLAPGRVRLAEVVDGATGEVLDEAVVTYFAGPRSYTGEDVVEIAAHGAPVVMEYLLRACCAGGARLAEPGEFTRRAFLSGRMDLTQAEAVGDLIAAGTMEQARVAARQMGGALARAVGPVKGSLVELIAEMEAGIDFAEDDISVLGPEAIVLRITEIEGPLEALARSFASGRVLREGFRLALVGRPNAGKSSLFNRLLERERAIVTAAPGTTRDTVAEVVSLGGVPVELVDTAGLRGASLNIDEAERLGMARSREAMAEAEVVALVVDARLPLGAEDVGIVEACRGRALVVAVNKVDLLEGAGERAAEEALRELGMSAVRVSALTGEGVEALREAILAAVGMVGDAGSAVVTNLRQRQAIAVAMAALGRAKGAAAVGVPHEMVLLDLYEGLRGLDELTGVTTTDDVLGVVFGRFCIGK